MFSGEAIPLVNASDCEYKLMHINGILSNPHQQLLSGRFLLALVASIGLTRPASQTSFLILRVTNPKPKRWRTAIKARENQLLTLAKEAMQEKERKLIHFLDYIDQDIAA